MVDAEGKAKTECGLHVDYFKMRAAFKARERALKKQKEEEEARKAAGEAAPSNGELNDVEMAVADASA